MSRSENKRKILDIDKSSKPVVTKQALASFALQQKCENEFVLEQLDKSEKEKATLREEITHLHQELDFAAEDLEKERSVRRKLQHAVITENFSTPMIRE